MLAFAVPNAVADDSSSAALTLAGDVAEHRFIDVDSDGRTELVTTSQDGQVTLWSFASDSGQFVVRGTLDLPDPEHAALALADVLAAPGLELCVLDRRGVRAHPLAPTGGWMVDATPLTHAARLGVRLGQPTFAPFVEDVNADGLPDLIVPALESCQLFLAGESDALASEQALSRYELTQTLPLRLTHEVDAQAGHLGTELSNSIRVAGLDIADLNGDGRPDLRVREGHQRRYHLQDANGHFADEPIHVDLSTFRDTTPRAAVQPGETLVLSDDARMTSGDLNGDQIPDYVIAHRRKVWSFLASAAGPQFEDSSTRLVAEDVSAVLLVDLNDDARDDLLIFKLDVPTSAELILGVVRSIDIPLRVLGYPTEPNGEFATRAEWKSELTLRVPSLLRVLREAEDIVERFRDVVRKFRWSAQGDFDGDGQDDLALLAEDEESVELWLRPTAADERNAARWLRQLLFSDPDQVFDVERLLKIVTEVFDARTNDLTSERGSDATQKLAPSTDEYLIDATAADLDGDGRAELILISTDVEGSGRRQFVVVAELIRREPTVPVTSEQCVALHAESKQGEWVTRTHPPCGVPRLPPRTRPKGRR